MLSKDVTKPMVPDKCFSSLQAVSFTVPSNTAQCLSRTLCSPAARSHTTSFGAYKLSKESVVVTTKWEKNLCPSLFL